MAKLFDQTLGVPDDSQRLAFGTPDAATGNITIANFKKNFIVDADGWVTPTLNTGYTSDAGNPLKYRINKLGHIEMKGLFTVTGSPANDIVFTLPGGSRPSKDIYFDYTIYLTTAATLGIINTSGQFRKADGSAWNDSIYGNMVNFIKNL